jgi:glyoxylase-like metal-dependent hydrolase (beta-lactamase superfamily II)
MQLLAKGLWQLSGFPRHWFNVYLAEDVLIDAATRWAKRRILRQLAKHSVRMVALTHCHPDHQGAAKVVCDQFSVPLACHEADAAAVEGRGPMLPQNRIIRLGQRIWAGPPCLVGRLLRDGDDVAGFRVVHTPGHTPGHVLFFRPEDRVTIMGDLLFNVSFLTGRPGLREPPRVFSADKAENRRSIQTLVSLKPSLVCFGHGPPLRNPALIERFLARRVKLSEPVLHPACG